MKITQTSQLSALSRSLSRLDDRGKNKLVNLGRIPIDCDPPLADRAEQYWIKKGKPLKNREHEAAVMEVVIAYYPHESVTGTDVNPAYLADAEIIIFDHKHYFEIDMDTESREQVVARMKTYLGSQKTPECDGAVMIVTTDEHRKQRLMKWLHFMKRSGHDEIMFFSTIHEVSTRPYRDIWEDLHGRKYGVECAVNFDVEDAV